MSARTREQDIERFEVKVADEVLADLRERLARTRFPDQIEGTGWSQGTERSYLEALCTYWRDAFDWRAQERALNAFDQYRTSIDGQRVHFLHVRSPHADAFPLLVTHGWPGSVYEFHKILGPLTRPEEHGGRREDAFHVVCPSLPGYGWSEPPRKLGFHPRRMAEIEAQLMAKLGYARYGAQGGDWGAVITTWIGAEDPHAVGIHLNMVLGTPPAGGSLEGLSPEEQKALAELDAFRREGVGYQQIQGTKPQTLGYGLNDSPAGLAAWILEKFHAWSDCGGDLESRFSKDELLTNIMIYWVTGSITSSTRLYYEMRQAGADALPKRVDTPTGCALFPREMMRPPRSWAEERYNVTRWTTFPRGGHFAALEEPALLVDDVRAFFRDLR